LISRQTCIISLLKKPLEIILLLFIILGKLYSQSPCDCSPTTAIEKQHRTDAKHEINYNNYPLKEDTITVDYIYNLEDTYSDKTQTIKTNPTNPLSKRCS